MNNHGTHYKIGRHKIYSVTSIMPDMMKFFIIYGERDRDHFHGYKRQGFHNVASYIPALLSGPVVYFEAAPYKQADLLS